MRSGESECTITILMATYNGEKYVKEQLQSIIDQTYRNYTLIVIDDCSTDNTVNIVNGFKKEIPSLSVQINSENQGTVKTFEKLLAQVETEFFCFADQDDVWHKNKLSQLYKKLVNENLALVYSDMTVVDEELEIVSNSMWKKSKIRPLNSRSLISWILKNPVSGCSLLCRSDALKNALPFPENIPMHDIWIVLCALSVGSIDYTSEPLLLYRQHSANQLGAIDSSLKGFRQRIKLHNEELPRYLSYRYQRRINLLIAAQNRLRNSISNRIFLFNYRSSQVVRLLLSPIYLFMLTLYCHELGFRNIGIEIILNTLPRRQ